MPFQRAVAIVLATVLPSFSWAQDSGVDVVGAALVSTFQKHASILVCAPPEAPSLTQMKELFQPFIKDIDVSSQTSYPAVVKAVYKAFPCPFSPERAELRAASKSDIVGTWLFPESSIKLRHGPKSAAWSANPGMPRIKCEAVGFQETGSYRVALIYGNVTCPTLANMQSASALPVVQSWSFQDKGRVAISRTDVPAQFEEWDVYVVQTPFERFSVQFAVGDLVAYLRRQPGNEMGATTTFRHLQLLR